MNGLWRIGASRGQATHQRRGAVDRGRDRHLVMSAIGGSEQAAAKLLTKDEARWIAAEIAT